MLNQVRVFENKDLGQIRAIEIDGQPWFVGKDVAEILGYSNTKDALIKHVDTEDKRILQRSQNTTFDIPTRGLTIINESGLYCLALSSKLPQAKIFRRWITSEVLPSLRKYGAYINDDVLYQMRNDSAYAAEIVQQLTDEKVRNNNLQNYVDKIEPKAWYYDIILQCPDAVQASIVAKDYGMSAMKFNKLLHALGVQYKIGKTWLLYSRYEGKGYTVSKTYKVNGVTVIFTCFTQQGRMWLYDLLKKNGILPVAERQPDNVQLSIV